MKYTDYKQVQELATNILREDKQMIQLTADLSTKLKNLEISFQDDGIDEVKANVNSLTSKLNSAQDSFMTIANELIQYAALLKKGKGKP